MKCLSILFCAFFVQVCFAQEAKTISYRQWQDLPQDTYVRIMFTADSLLRSYKNEPFNVQKKDGSCCFKGLMVIREFYERALIERPGDEDAKARVNEVSDMITDETLLYEEKQYLQVEKRGDHYLEKGYFKKAHQFYLRAYELSPGSRQLKKKIRTTYKRVKRYEKI